MGHGRVGAHTTHTEPPRTTVGLWASTPTAVSLMTYGPCGDFDTAWTTWELCCHDDKPQWLMKLVKYPWYSPSSPCRTLPPQNASSFCGRDGVSVRVCVRVCVSHQVQCFPRFCRAQRQLGAVRALEPSPARTHTVHTVSTQPAVKRRVAHPCGGSTCTQHHHGHQHRLQPSDTTVMHTHTRTHTHTHTRTHKRICPIN